MAKKYTYIPLSEIESLTTWNGKEISGSKLLDGAYAKGKVQFADGGMMAKGGEIKDYDRQPLPKKVFLNGKEFNGEVVVINGYNGYTSTPDDGLLSAIVGNSAFDIKNKKPYLLKDEDGFYIMKKGARGNYFMMADGGMMKKGGKVRKYTYIPKDEIESISTWNGKEISGSKLLDGAYAKGTIQFKHGGMNKYRKPTIEERAEQSVGSYTWHSLDSKTKAGVIAELATEGFIPEVMFGKGGGVSDEVMVVFTLVGGKKVKKKFAADEVDEGIANFYGDNDVEDLEIQEKAPAPAPKQEAPAEEPKKKKGLFELAKEEPKKAGKKETLKVEVDGIAEQIRQFDEYKAAEKAAKAGQELIGGELKQIGREKYLELYEKLGRRPDSFNLADGGEEVLFMVQDKYITLTPEKEEVIKAIDPNLLGVDIEYKFNSETLDKTGKNGQRIGDIINDLIMDCDDISDEDKLKLLTVKRYVAIKKGTIEHLLDYKNPAEVMELVQPIVALK